MLDAATSDSSGSPALAGSISVALDAFTGVASGAPSVSGSLSTVLDSATCSATGDVVAEYSAPPARSYAMAGEDRVMLVVYTAVEVLRTMTTGQQSRSMSAQAEDRQAEPQTEGRTLYVGAESRTELAEGE